MPRGAFAIWVGGAADRAIVPALRAGFRLDQFPVLLCWDRPFADFARYLPISPGPALSADAGAGPWSGAAGTVVRLPDRGPGGSLDSDVAPPAVPADGVASS